MKHTRILLGVNLTAFVVVLPLLAMSCADTEGGQQDAPPPSQVPESSSVPDGTSSEAGGCKASDPNCVVAQLSCDEASWCPSKTGVSAFYVLSKVWGASKNDVWAVGSGGTIIHWDGATWTPSVAPPSPLDVQYTFFALWGSGANDVWIASSTETIFRNTGAGWVRQPPLPLKKRDEVPVYSLWGDGTGAMRAGTRAYDFTDELPDGEVYYIGGNEMTKATADPAGRWALHEGTASIIGYYGTADDLWMIADNSVYNPWEGGLTFHGVRAKPTDALVWSKVESHAIVKLRAIWGSSTDDIWAVGDQGAMRRMRRGQSSWEVIPPVTKESLYVVWGASATDVWVAGENGTILHYDGTEWRPDMAAFEAGKYKPHLTGVWGSGPDDVWIVGGGAALHYTGKKGGSK